MHACFLLLVETLQIAHWQKKILCSSEAVHEMGDFFSSQYQIVCDGEAPSNPELIGKVWSWPDGLRLPPVKVCKFQDTHQCHEGTLQKVITSKMKDIISTELLVDEGGFVDQDVGSTLVTISQVHFSAL
jgi:hypothetical protein